MDIDQEKRKRDAPSSEEPDWVHLNTDANGLKMNQYFIDHPEMVMGEMREISGPYGPETACLPIEGRDLGEQLAAAIQNIQGSITEYVMDDPETEGEDKSIPADPEVRNFSYTIVDGKVYYRENSRMNPVEVSVTAANRIKGLIGIRDCVRTLIEYQTEDWPDQDIQAQQRKLNALYDAFVDKYGRINSRANSSAFSMDSAYFLLTSLEVLDDERNFVRKADKLIAKGIPAEEIAYIHSANTETQKKELFGKVRSGQVRVLIGSTQKMGAGTNVQKKLVALHHLDCPWRPSDLQQREGRIIRQGNENNEVDIYTYVTENTFDSYLYQLVEGKQKFIGQIMTSKSPVRACEDIDETALSYAEIKALCTGNPHIKEKMDLDIDVQRLRLLKANHLSQRYALEDQIIKELPQQIAKYEQYIEGYLSDMDRLKENTHPNEDGFSPMEVEGTVYTDKKAAGSAILAACKAMTSPEPVPLGQYRGFSMDLSFASLTREFKVTLKGALYYTTNLGTDVFGNILRLDNLLESMEERINTCREQLENTRMQLENAKLEVDKPFPQEDELKRKSARLDELNILLNMDKRESEIVDGDVGDEVTAPARGSPDRER